MRQLYKCEQQPFETFYFYRYSASDRASMGRYASQHGVAAAASVFTHKLQHHVSETTVRSLKKAYLEQKRNKRAVEDDNDVDVLPPKKRGRPVLLGDDVDQKLQLYVRKVREGGEVITARILIAAARGIIAACNHSSLVEFGGHVQLSRHWAYSLLHRMKFVNRKVTTAKSKYSTTDFIRLKEEFLRAVVETVEMEEIPPELILNWDQTAVKIIPSSTWTMEQRGSKRIDVAGANDKRAITVVFCGSLVGDFLPLQVIFKGKTPRCHPRFHFPSDWDITHSPRHWSNESTTLQYIDNILVLYVQRRREDYGEETAAVVIMDNFKGQITQSVTSRLESNNIHTCLLPANTTDRLQPMDLSVNKSAKSFLKQCFEQWYSDQVIKQLEGKDIE